MLKNILVAFFTSLIIFTCSYTVAQSAIPENTQNIQQSINQAYEKYKNVTAGKNADYIPELAKVNPAYFGIAVATVDGKIISVGDADVPFAIESISKPFVYALALEDNGEEAVHEKVGLDATGHAFNSVAAIEEKQNHLQNPLVNAGAIQVTDMIKGKNSEEKWQRVLTLMQKLSNGKPYLGQAVYQSEMATNQHNRGIAMLLHSYGMMSSEIDDAVDRYTKACSVMVTTKELALMGATLANGGVNPITHQQVIPARYIRNILSQMATNGLYENSGSWWLKVGVPAKSGVGGGIVAVVPHKMAIAVFSPPLDAAGNSVRGQDVITDLAAKWKLHTLD